MITKLSWRYEVKYIAAILISRGHQKFPCTSRKAHKNPQANRIIQQKSEQKKMIHTDTHIHIDRGQRTGRLPHTDTPTDTKPPAKVT